MSCYCLDRNLAFIHIPKNAGTSIRQALKMKDFDAIDRKVRDARDPDLANHFPVYRIQRLLKLANSDIPFDGMYKFMVVRNPWERMVSLYYHRKRKISRPGRYNRSEIEAVKAGFGPWLKTSPSALMTMPQSEWGLAENGSFVVDRVLLVERLDEDWAALCENRGLRHIKLPRTNVGKGRSEKYREHYDDETREAVAERFRDDIKRFGYAF